jgi:hypothetical protein
VIAYVKFEDALQKIFAVQALPRRRPDLLNDDAIRLAESFVLPDESLAGGDRPLPPTCMRGGRVNWNTPGKHSLLESLSHSMVESCALRSETRPKHRSQFVS